MCVILNFDNEDIIFCWVPSHTQILVLEATKWQTNAKSALELPQVKVGVPYTDFKPCISQYVLSTLQVDWNGAVANKLQIGSPPIGSAGRIKWSCVMPTSVILI